MAMAGSLSEVGLADICQLLALGRKTGRLTVTNRADLGYIFFNRGRITQASVLNRPDRLGELLVLNGAITREQLHAGMDQQAIARGERLGQVLIDQGAISEEELAHYIRIQIEEAAFHLFTWTQGTFRFEPDALPDAEGIFLISASAESLLLEGARRVDEWELIRRKIPSDDLVFRIDRDPADDEVGLTEAQRRIIPLVDGKRTVGELVVSSGLVEFEAVKALFGLIQAGFARAVTKGPGGDGEGSVASAEAQPRIDLGVAFLRTGMLDDAVRELSGAADAAPDDPRPSYWLGVAAIRGGDYESAVEHFAESRSRGGDGFALHLNHALALEELGRWSDADAALDAAEEVRPGHARALLSRGILQLRRGQPKAARASLESYRRALGPEDPPPIWYAFAPLATAAAGMGHEARELAELAMAEAGDNPSVLINAAHVLQRVGDGGEAESLYLRAVSGRRPPAQAHKNLGDIAMDQGDLAGARAHYERAIRIDPRLGDDVYQRLGDIVYREEDHEWAEALWGRALEINPENQVVRTNLDLLSTASKE